MLTCLAESTFTDRRNRTKSFELSNEEVITVNLASALAELGDRLGIGVIKLDQNGGCCWHSTTSSWSISNPLTPSFHLTATVGPSTGARARGGIRRAARKPIWGAAPGPACLALDADLDGSCWSRSIYRADIEVDYLEQELDAF